MKETFSPYTKSLHFDLSTSTFIGTKVEDGIYPWDEEPDIATTKTPIGSEQVKKLVKNLDKNIKI